jgi:hypothetical protein
MDILGRVFDAFTDDPDLTDVRETRAAQTDRGISRTDFQEIDVEVSSP